MRGHCFGRMEKAYRISLVCMRLHIASNLWPTPCSRCVRNLLEYVGLESRLIRTKTTSKLSAIIDGCLIRDYPDNDPIVFLHLVSKDCHRIHSTKLLIAELTNAYDI